MATHPSSFPRAWQNRSDCKEPPDYSCPICGSRLLGGDTVAEDKDGDIVGCFHCIRYGEVWEKFLNDDI